MKAKPQAVICDLDGSLCNIDHRLHYIQGKSHQKDYDAFYYEVLGDSVNSGVKEWISSLFSRGIMVVLVSGRRWTCEFATREWLQTHKIPYHALHMTRGVKDHRSDTTIKEEILARLLEEYEILFVIDDRPSVVEMWRSHNLKVYPVFQDRWQL
jgi:hypothetical protein